MGRRLILIQKNLAKASLICQQKITSVAQKNMSSTIVHRLGTINNILVNKH